MAVGSSVAVGGSAVLVGGTAVRVGGIAVLVGGTTVGVKIEAGAQLMSKLNKMTKRVNSLIGFMISFSFLIVMMHWAAILSQRGVPSPA